MVAAECAKTVRRMVHAQSGNDCQDANDPSENYRTHVFASLSFWMEFF